MTTAFDFTARSIDGTDASLADFDGKVLLIVNTATQCGFTPQLAGLEQLYQSHADRGLVVLGFPCDQFGNQNPGDDDSTADFCQRNYGVTFPMFSKVDVNGPQAHELFSWLRSQKRGVGPDSIKWNFTKFLVNRNGSVVKRYGPTTKPEKIAADLEPLLAA